MLEKNKIYCMDCEGGLKKLKSNSIDLVVTSPPYDNLRTYGNKIEWNFDKFKTIAKELYRVTKDGGVVVWVIGDATIDGSETGTSFRQALFFMEIGFDLYDTMIYEKNTSAFPTSVRYEQVFEYMFVLSKGKPKTINLLKDKKNRWAGTSNFGDRTNRQKDGSLKKTGKSVVAEYGIRTNIFRYSTGANYTTTEKYAFKHPAMFPEKLAKDHILSWSNKGDLILDPFMGSGTTAKMAKVIGRNFIGFEISKEYCKIIDKRLEQDRLIRFFKGGEKK